MICKNCNTEFDTSKVRLGESIRCPGCGKVYQRKAITATSKTTKKATPRKTAKKAKKSKKKTLGGLIALLCIFIVLTLLGIAGIITYHFSPVLFSKITSRVLKNNATWEEPYVLTASTTQRYNAEGTVIESSKIKYSYFANGLIHSVSFDNTKLLFAYEYDSAGYPTSIRLFGTEADYNSYKYLEIHVQTEHRNDGIDIVTFEGVPTGTVSIQMFQAYSLYRNANLSDGENEIQIRDGKIVLNRRTYSGIIEEMETTLHKDGSKTESTKTTYTDRTVTTISEFDNKGRLQSGFFNTGEATGTIELKYFHVNEEQSKGFTEYGIITKIISSMEGYVDNDLGDIAKQYIYDKNSRLVLEEKYDGVHAQPIEQRFFENNKLIRTVNGIYFGEDRADEIHEYAPLSQASETEADAKADGQQRPSPETSTITAAPVDNMPYSVPTETASVLEPTTTLAPVSNVPETPEPTSEPTATPTSEPTATPTSEPTTEPTATPTAKPTATPSPSPTPVIVQYGTITNVTKRGTVRIEPSEDSERIGALAKGSIVEVLEIGENYTKIRYSGGVAYIHTSLFTFSATGKIVNVNSRATVRSQPTSESDRLGTVDKGKSVTVLESVGEWVKIQYGNKIGYVFGEYVKIDVTKKLLD